MVVARLPQALELPGAPTLEALQRSDALALSLRQRVQPALQRFHPLPQPGLRTIRVPGGAFRGSAQLRLPQRFEACLGGLQARREGPLGAVHLADGQLVLACRESSTDVAELAHHGREGFSPLAPNLYTLEVLLDSVQLPRHGVQVRPQARLLLLLQLLSAHDHPCELGPQPGAVIGKPGQGRGDLALLAACQLRTEIGNLLRLGLVRAAQSAQVRLTAGEVDLHLVEFEARGRELRAVALREGAHPPLHALHALEQRGPRTRLACWPAAHQALERPSAPPQCRGLGGEHESRAVRILRLPLARGQPPLQPLQPRRAGRGLGRGGLGCPAQILCGLRRRRLARPHARQQLAARGQPALLRRRVRLRQLGVALLQGGQLPSLLAEGRG
mmetsp:Transcript_100882/g.274307  ORF Transcript_100882/g.274307 Transcript_100882/m.274307 type:complete len:387 (+) Transcript_100882:323-1483(+)